MLHGYEVNPVEMFRRSVNHLFDNFFAGIDMTPARWYEGTEKFHPCINMSEDDQSIRFTTELPGMDEKDVEILLNKETLTIKGQKREEKEEKGKESYYIERSFGSFQRVIPIPAEVNPDKGNSGDSIQISVIKVDFPRA